MIRAIRLLCRGSRTLACFLGLTVALVSAIPVTEWYAKSLAGPWGDPDGDVLIVLGGSEIGGGIFGQDSYWRTAYAAMAYRRRPFRKILVCGAGVAAPMRTFLVASGVPEHAIQEEAASRSTRENALNAARLVGAEPGRKVLLTSDYHMFRAHRAFSMAGLAVEPRPFPDAIKRSLDPVERWAVFLEELKETAKIIYYRARGWI